MTDNDIINLFFDRNERAITETSGKYSAYCGKIASNILPSREDVEECLNDTWMNAWNSIPPQHPDSLKVYLGSIVRNLSINIYNRIHASKRCDSMTVMLSELDECIPSGYDTENVIETGFLTEIINTWLKTLKETDRNIFIRRYWYNISVKDLARENLMSANAMTNKLKRLRKKLQEEIEKEGYSI